VETLFPVSPVDADCPAVLHSSALPCGCSSTYPVRLSFAQIILSFVRKQGSRSVAEHEERNI